MKQYIILIASVVLGLFIFNLVAGGDNSIKSAMGQVWQHEVSQTQIYP